MTKEIEIKVNDDQGMSHRYVFHLHPAEEGIDVILPKVMRILSNSAGPIIDAVSDSKVEGESVLDMDIGIGSVGSGLAKGIQAFTDELIKAGGTNFLKEVLKYSVRYSDDGTGKKAYTAFNEIYTGNYGELSRVIFQIIKANFGPSLRASTANVNMSKMTSLLERLNG